MKKIICTILLVVLVAGLAVNSVLALESESTEPLLIEDLMVCDECDAPVDAGEPDSVCVRDTKSSRNNTQR